MWGGGQWGSPAETGPEGEGQTLSVYPSQIYCREIMENFIVVFLVMFGLYTLLYAYLTIVAFEANTARIQVLQHDSRSVLAFASERLQDNDVVVQRAVQQDGHALMYASKRLRDNGAMVDLAMKQVDGKLS